MHKNPNTIALFLLPAIVSMVILDDMMKDKQTEREARQFITQAHKRGNAAVGKVVDYTKQNLGYVFSKSDQTKPNQTKPKCN